MTVNGEAEIPDQSTVVSWAEIDNVGELAGTKEAFYCSVKYSAPVTDTGEDVLDYIPEGANVDVQTYEGTAIDLAVTAEGEPSKWYQGTSWDV